MIIHDFDDVDCSHLLQIYAAVRLERFRVVVGSEDYPPHPVHVHRKLPFPVSHAKLVTPRGGNLLHHLKVLDCRQLTEPLRDGVSAALVFLLKFLAGIAKALQFGVVEPDVQSAEAPDDYYSL